MTIYRDAGRTPQGVRGLKCYMAGLLLQTDVSHPARGAWIEINDAGVQRGGRAGSHPARGAWIEISLWTLVSGVLGGRTPQGVRGLKSVAIGHAVQQRAVAPRKGCVD